MGGAAMNLVGIFVASMLVYNFDMAWWFYAVAPLLSLGDFFLDAILEHLDSFLNSS